MGSSELFLLLGLFLAGLSVYYFVSSLLSNNTDNQILSWASGDEPNQSKSPLINFSRPLVHQFTLQHAARVKSERYRKNVKKKILTSGLSSEINVDEFIGLQILWGFLFPLFFLLINFALEIGFHSAFVILISVVGVYFPHFYTGNEKKRRALSILADLPFFIDLLALSTEAGLDFASSIQRIVDKADASILADEFSNVLKDIKLGSSRAESLRAMAHRIDLPEITSFVSVVVDADSTGASIAQVLKDQSVQMRHDRFVRAEKAGAKASQAIILPLMLFILPAVFIMVFGPVILQFMYGN